MKKVLCAGSLIADLIHKKVKQLPKEGECIITDINLKLGGNAYSMSVNMKRLAGSQAEVHCYGQIGNDHLGSLFNNSLKKEGIISELRVTSKNTSSIIILQQKNKDRRYLLDLGANQDFFIKALIESISKIKPDVIMLGELPTLRLIGDDFIQFIEHVKQINECIIFADLMIMDGESYSWMKGHWNKIDIIHCNKGEGEGITGQKNISGICRCFVDWGVKLAVISDGAEGCVYNYKDNIKSVPAFKTVEVDATGAGDAMCAGITVKILENDQKLGSINEENIEKFITFGSACGSIAVTALGCINDITREKVEKFLKY